MRVLAGAVFVLALTFSSRAAVIHVPADYPTIQGAVDGAVSGDEIQIAAGVYTEQVVITNKSLTLSGSPGAVLRATTGMQQSLMPFAGAKATAVALLGIFEGDAVISGLTFEGERLADSQPGELRGIWFVAASGRVENCRIIGFRGPTLGSPTNQWGLGLQATNPHGYGIDMANIQVLRSTFADNVLSIQLIGDQSVGTNQPWFPDQLRTSFVVNDNTIVGNGPDAMGRQFGIHIWAGAGGEVKRNIISNHAYTGTNDPIPYSFGVLADDEVDFGEAPLAALRPVHFEGNIFRHNQIDLLMERGDGSTVVNNTFEGTGPGPRPTGLAFSGDNVLVGTNHFSDLETGILLFGDDPDFGTYLGVASNATLIANGFCNVATNFTVESPATYTEQGTVACPWPKLEIRAVQLSWPYSYNGYSVETAPGIDGPWSPSGATVFDQGGQNHVVIPAETDQQFFLLARP